MGFRSPDEDIIFQTFDLDEQIAVAVHLDYALVFGTGFSAGLFLFPFEFFVFPFAAFSS